MGDGIVADGQHLVLGLGGSFGSLPGTVTQTSMAGGLSLEAMWMASDAVFVSAGVRGFYQDSFSGGGEPNFGAQAVAEFGLFNFGSQVFAGATNRGLRIGGGFVARFPLGRSEGARPYLQVHTSLAYQGNMFAPSRSRDGTEFQLGLHAGIDFDLR